MRELVPPAPQAPGYTRDASDPNKFREPDDSEFQDALQWAILLGALWCVWQAYSTLIKP